MAADDPHAHTGRMRSAATWGVALTGAIVAVSYALADRVMEDVLGIESLWGQAAEVVVMAIVTSLVLWTIVLRPLHRAVRREREAAAQRQAELTANISLQDFETRLHRALEMASTELDSYRVIRKALGQGVEDVDAELKLADSSDSHLKTAVWSSSEEAGALCDVESPRDCPAVRQAQTLVFTSADALDACPHLDDRPTGACSAACVPMSVSGRTIGVLHAVAADQHPPTRGQIQRLEAVAAHAGSRIGLLRVMTTTTLQAATDPLTGLLNRRSLEQRVHQLLIEQVPFALVMADLDHFKSLNDTHGHDSGDRALRLFARSLRNTLRDDDLLSRYGGEEFVIVLPDQTAEEAAAVLRRFQTQLGVALESGTVPSFTCSFGIAHSSQATSLDQLCRIADVALFQAKREGRNRIVVDAPASRF